MQWGAFWQASDVSKAFCRTPVRLADLSLQHLMSYKVCPPEADTASMLRWHCTC